MTPLPALRPGPLRLRRCDYCRRRPRLCARVVGSAKLCICVECYEARDPERRLVDEVNALPLNPETLR